MNSIPYAIVPAAQGFEWVRSSVRIFRSQWLRYTSIAALFLLIMQVASVVSGGLLFAFLKPVLSVGFLAAAWHHERGELPEARHLFAGFKSNLKALLSLGGVYLIGVVVAASLAVLLLGITLEQLVVTEGQPKPNEQTQMRFMLVTLLFSLPLTGALWFAPALIVFSDATFGQALLVSVRACFSNWLAMTSYAAAMFLLVLATAIIASPTLYFPQNMALMLVMILAVPLLAIAMISDYVSYRRVFHSNEQVEPKTSAM